MRNLVEFFVNATIAKKSLFLLEFTITSILVGIFLAATVDTLFPKEFTQLAMWLMELRNNFLVPLHFFSKEIEIVLTKVEIGTTVASLIVSAILVKFMD